MTHQPSDQLHFKTSRQPLRRESSRQSRSSIDDLNEFLFTGKRQMFCVEADSFQLPIQKSWKNGTRHFVATQNILECLELQRASFQREGVTLGPMRDPLTLQMLIPERIECHDQSGNQVINVFAHDDSDEEESIDSDEDLSDLEEAYLA